MPNTDHAISLSLPENGALSDAEFVDYAGDMVKFLHHAAELQGQSDLAELFLLARAEIVRIKRLS